MVFNNRTEASIYCLSSRICAYESFDFLGKNCVPSKFLEKSLGTVSQFDDSTWMVWSKPTSSPVSTNDTFTSRKSSNNQVLLQKVNDSVADLLQEFDT